MSGRALKGSAKRVAIVAAVAVAVVVLRSSAPGGAAPEAALGASAASGSRAIPVNQSAQAGVVPRAAANPDTAAPTPAGEASVPMLFGSGEPNRRQRGLGGELTLEPDPLGFAAVDAPGSPDKAGPAAEAAAELVGPDASVAWPAIPEGSPPPRQAPDNAVSSGPDARDSPADDNDGSEELQASGAAGIVAAAPEPEPRPAPEPGTKLAAIDPVTALSGWIIGDYAWSSDQAAVRTKPTPAPRPKPARRDREAVGPAPPVAAPEPETELAPEPGPEPEGEPNPDPPAKVARLAPSAPPPAPARSTSTPESEINPVLRDLLVETIRMSNEGRIERALANLDRILEHEPDYARALHHRARLLMFSSKYDAAIADLERLTALEPANVNAQITEGQALLLADRSGEALTIADRITEESPGKSAAYYLRARAHAREGEVATALSDCDFVGIISRSDAAMHWCEGVVHRDAGKPETAVEIWTTLLAGSDAAFVRSRQEYLAQIGMYVGTIDGLFGDATKLAIRKCAATRFCG